MIMSWQLVLLPRYVILSLLLSKKLVSYYVGREKVLMKKE